MQSRRAPRESQRRGSQTNVRLGVPRGTVLLKLVLPPGQRVSALEAHIHTREIRRPRGLVPVRALRRTCQGLLVWLNPPALASPG